MSQFLRQQILLVLGVLLSMPGLAWAQGTGGGGGGAGGAGAGGIRIDARGMLTAEFESDATKLLDAKRRRADSLRVLSAETSRPSTLRAICLPRLEQACLAWEAQQDQLPHDLRYLAGVTRVDALFVYPERHSIVVVGPAEPLAPDQAGRLRGTETGRPALHLEDFIVALRTIGTTPFVGCSIDPDPGRLAKLNDYLRQLRGAATEDVQAARLRKMAEVLGPQSVRIDGVPPESRFSLTLVAADWRMKRISLGLEKTGVPGLKSFLAMVKPGSANAMQRWWFAPHYTRLAVSEDRLAWSWAGPRAQLMGQEELPDEQGTRYSVQTPATTLAYARQFTQHFAALADRSPVFGELQQLVDWTLIAGILHQQRLPQAIDWKLELWNHPQRWPITAYPVPREVASLVNTRATANTVVGQVGGGVTLHASQLVREFAVASDADRLTGRWNAATPAASMPDKWWWDIAPSEE